MHQAASYAPEDGVEEEEDLDSGVVSVRRMNE